MANFVEGILSPLKTASSLLQEAIEVHDSVKFGDVVVKLQAQIMAAQQGALAAWRFPFFLSLGGNTLRPHALERLRLRVQRGAHESFEALLCLLFAVTVIRFLRHLQRRYWPLSSSQA
jgi:hypothetical protein